MRKTALMIRCVPRFGFDNTEVRMIELDVAADAEGDELQVALEVYFSARGIADAVYDVKVDDYGWFAVVNDEAYEAQWGTPLR